MTIAYIPTDDEIAGSCDVYALEAGRLRKRYVFVPPYGVVLHHKGERELNHCFFNVGDNIIVNCKRDTGYGVGLHGKSGNLDTEKLSTEKYQVIPRTEVIPQHLNHVVKVNREDGKIKSLVLNTVGYLYDSAAYQWFLVPDILEVASVIRTHDLRVFEHVSSSTDNGFLTIRYTTAGGEENEETENLQQQLAKSKRYIKTKSGLSYPTRSWRK